MAGTTPTYKRPRGMMGHMPPMSPEVHMKHILSQTAQLFELVNVSLSTGYLCATILADTI